MAEYAVYELFSGGRIQPLLDGDGPKLGWSNRASVEDWAASRGLTGHEYAVAEVDDSDPTRGHSGSVVRVLVSLVVMDGTPKNWVEEHLQEQLEGDSEYSLTDVRTVVL